MRGAKRKLLPPPPNQADIRSFIGGSSNWKVGETPLTPKEQKQMKAYLADPENAERNHFHEAEIHQRIFAAGTFNYFGNQQAALAYLNGQYLMRKNQDAKIKDFEKSVGNFEKSGLTKRFLKIPSRLLPQDRSNCEREVARANKLVSDLGLFKEELIKLKTSCLDETKSVKRKKTEEFEYFSEKVLEMNHLNERIARIVTKLNHTNIHINKSSGLFTTGVSILENKRIMRRKKENRRNERKDAFKRNVASLTTFLQKYTNKDFKAAFEVHEKKVITSKNQYTGVSKSNKSGQSDVEMSGIDGDLPREQVEEEVCDDSEEDMVEEVLGAADERVNLGDDGIEQEEVDQNMNMVDCVDLSNDRPVLSKKSRYVHEKIVKTIKPTTKLGEEDFKSLEFGVKDLKALKLLLEIRAVQDSVVDVIQSFLYEKEETVIDSSEADITDDLIVIETEELERADYQNQCEKMQKNENLFSI